MLQPDLDILSVYGYLYILKLSLRKEGGCQELV